MDAPGIPSAANPKWVSHVFGVVPKRFLPPSFNSGGSSGRLLARIQTDKSGRPQSVLSYLGGTHHATVNPPVRTGIPCCSRSIRKSHSRFHCRGRRFVTAREPGREVQILRTRCASGL